MWLIVFVDWGGDYCAKDVGCEMKTLTGSDDPQSLLVGTVIHTPIHENDQPHVLAGRCIWQGLSHGASGQHELLIKHNDGTPFAMHIYIQCVD
jgi:hypothetical protein